MYFPSSYAIAVGATEVYYLESARMGISSDNVIRL